MKLTRLLCALLCAAMLMSAFGCGETNPPEGSSPDVSTSGTPDVSSPAGSSPVESPSETEPAVFYMISYELDGGIDGGNPISYTENDEFTLTIPVRPGYTFIGWTGNGITSPTVEVKVSKGTKGDLSFTAHWEEKDEEAASNGLNTEFFGKDDGLTPAENTPVSTTDLRGLRGEGMYVMKTVYTDIAIDGTMDAAYTYGVHFKSDIPNDKAAYEKGHKASFDVYMVRGQDGKAYIYIDVTDSDIVVNSHLFSTLGKAHWCDCLHVYYELGNEGKAISHYEIVADPSGRFVSKPPKEYKIVATDKGYAVEFAMETKVDEFSIGVYLNETSNWNDSTKTYDRVVLKHSSVKNPVSAGYLAPTAALHDAVKCSAESASGNFDVFAPKAEKSGDVLKDIANRADSVLVTYDENATAQTILSAEDLKKYLDSCGVRSYLKREDRIEEGESYGYYILMGMTDREESIELISKLN